MDFYNPKMSVLTLGVSMLKGTVQLSLAKSLNPNFSGKVEKGQKIYDREHMLFYSFSPEECLIILENWTKIFDGTYINDKEKNEQFKKIFSITHYRESSPYRMVLSRTKDNQGNLTGSLILTLIPPQGQGTNISYVFRPRELTRFRFYLECGSKYLEFVKDCIDGVGRAKKYEDRQGQSGKPSTGGEFNPLVGNESPPTPQQQEQTFDQMFNIGNDSGNVQNVENVADIDFMKF